MAVLSRLPPVEIKRLALQVAQPLFAQGLHERERVEGGECVRAEFRREIGIGAGHGLERHEVRRRMVDIKLIDILVGHGGGREELGEQVRQSRLGKDDHPDHRIDEIALLFSSDILVGFSCRLEHLVHRVGDGGGDVVHRLEDPLFRA